MRIFRGGDHAFIQSDGRMLNLCAHLPGPGRAGPLSPTVRRLHSAIGDSNLFSLCSMVCPNLFENLWIVGK